MALTLLFCLFSYSVLLFIFIFGRWPQASNQTTGISQFATPLSTLLKQWSCQWTGMQQEAYTGWVGGWTVGWVKGRWRPLARWRSTAGADSAARRQGTRLPAALTTNHRHHHRRRRHRRHPTEHRTHPQQRCTAFTSSSVNSVQFHASAARSMWAAAALCFQLVRPYVRAYGRGHSRPAFRQLLVNNYS